jgi:hypothetical protein
MTETGKASQAAPFGLEWDQTLRSVRERFSGLTPVAEAEHAISYPLIELAERIWSQGGFCPGALMSTPERNGDEVTFAFVNDRLNSVFLRFGYGFGHIGQDPDTLSDQAMSARARAEFHKLVFELAVKYGPPAVMSDEHSRSGAIHVQGMALFDSPDAGLLQLTFGHDGGSALIGEIWYHARRPHVSGF